VNKMKSLREMILKHNVNPTGKSESDGYWILQTDHEAIMNQIMINIHELEASAQKVYGDKDGDWSLESYPSIDTHTALLIGVEKIEKRVSKAEIVESLRSAIAYTDTERDLEELARRIEQFGIEV
jgi:hypothetical protein